MRKDVADTLNPPCESRIRLPVFATGAVELVARGTAMMREAGHVEVKCDKVKGHDRHGLAHGGWYAGGRIEWR